nr:hypothetical protein B0A51_17266 [Rachicladosporium sp. CCFEE 5018]
MKHTTSKIKQRGGTIMRVAHKLVVKRASASPTIGLLALCLAGPVVVLVTLQEPEQAQNNTTIIATLPSANPGILESATSDLTNATVLRCPDMPFPFMEYTDDTDAPQLCMHESSGEPAPTSHQSHEPSTFDHLAYKNASLIATLPPDSTEMLDVSASDPAHTMVMRCPDELSIRITYYDEPDFLELHTRAFGALTAFSSAA